MTVNIVIVWEFIKLFGRSVRDFFRDGGMMLAGSLSYFSIMAVVPLCLFLMAVFFYLIGDNNALFAFISAKIVNFFPKAAHAITEELKEAISYRGVGFFTLIAYGILSYQLYSSMEYALNVVFKVKERRSFFSHLMISMFIFTLLIIFILISFGTSSSIPILNSLRNRIPGVEIHAVTSFLVKYVVPFLLAFLTIAAFYIIMPKRRIKWSSALTGALIATVFHELAKHAFTFYVVKFSKLGAIYGSLAAFIIFLLWAFYSSCIFLIGAEIVHNLEIRRKQR